MKELINTACFIHVVYPILTINSEVWRCIIRKHIVSCRYVSCFIGFHCAWLWLIKVSSTREDVIIVCWCQFSDVSVRHSFHVTCVVLAVFNLGLYNGLVVFPLHHRSPSSRVGHFTPVRNVVSCYRFDVCGVRRTQRV